MVGTSHIGNCFFSRFGGVGGGAAAEWYGNGRLANGIIATAGGTDLPNLRGTGGGVTAIGLDKDRQEDARRIAMAAGSSLTLRGEGSGSFRISYSLEAAPSGPVRATSGTATTDLTTGLTLAAGKGWREMLLTPACLADAGDSLTIRTEAPLTFSLASVERVSLPEGTACSF